MPTLRAFGRFQAARRLERVSYEMERARGGLDEEQVHDLRVSIRRLSSCLTTFPELFPPGRFKQATKRLRRVMKAAGEVRDRDIALALGAAAGLEEDSPPIAALRKERKKLAAELDGLLSKKKRGKILGAARDALGLD